MLTKASSTCRPAPVRPPPGNSSGDNRQPLVIFCEFSLLLWPSMWRIVPSSPLASDFAQRAHRRPEAPVMADGEDHAGLAAGLEHAARRRRGVSASGFSQNICFRAAAQAITCAGCSECGVASRTALDRASARTASRSAVKSRSCRAQNSCAAVDVGLDGADDLQPLGGRRRLRPDCGPSGRGRQWRRGSSQALRWRTVAGSPR